MPSVVAVGLAGAILAVGSLLLIAIAVDAPHGAGGAAATTLVAILALPLGLTAWLLGIGGAALAKKKHTRWLAGLLIPVVLALLLAAWAVPSVF